MTSWMAMDGGVEEGRIGQNPTRHFLSGSHREASSLSTSKGRDNH